MATSTYVLVASCVWRDITQEVLTLAFRRHLVARYEHEKAMAYYRARREASSVNVRKVV